MGARLERFRNIGKGGKMENVKDLGYMNGWRADPPEWVEHKKCPPEEVVRENLGPCNNRYTCPNCKISWKVDSSG